MQRGRVAGTKMTARQFARYVGGVASGKKPEELIQYLTFGEQAVLRLASQGLPNKEIAKRLFVEPCTVKAHLAIVYFVLGVANRTEAAAALFNWEWAAGTQDVLVPEQIQ